MNVNDLTVLVHELQRRADNLQTHAHGDEYTLGMAGGFVIAADKILAALDQAAGDADDDLWEAA